MKRWIIGLLVLTAVGLGTYLIIRGGADVRQVGASPGSSATVEELDVELFMRDVDRFRGVVRVIGVVNTASAADQMLTLLDRREFEECGVTTCASLYLPVRWGGEMPSSGETVRIKGKTQSEGDKLVFVAQLLERVVNP